MKFSLYLDDYETEKIFSYLRWIFLLISLILFYVPPISDVLQFNRNTFPLLFTIGIVYMALAQITLQRMNSQNKYFSIIIKAGIVFDFIVLFWLLLLTGGVNSPLFPITYLVVMHATIYWKTKGAFISSIACSFSYFIILAFEKAITTDTIVSFSLNLCFLWIIGLFGSMIVLRERKHLRQKELYYEQMVTDYLTGLYNHRSFQEELIKTLNREDPFVLVMGDIDHFKLINDRHGHQVGDEVLLSIGGLFTEIMAKHGGKAFRYGGEEFAMLFPNYDDHKLLSVFKDIYEGMNELSFTNEEWRVAMSFGVARSNNVNSRDELLHKADQLLYQAKNRGKSQVIFDNGVIYVNKQELNRKTV